MNDDRAGASSSFEDNSYFKILIDSAVDSIFCKDLNFRYTYANSAMLGLLKLNVEDIVGKTAHEVWGSGPADPVVDMNSRVFEGSSVSTSWSTEIDGEQRYFNTIETPLRNGDGEIFGLVGIMRDVTERHRAEQALGESRRRYQSLSEILPIGVVVHRDGRVLDGNNLVFEMFGYTREELIGKNAMEMIIDPNFLNGARERIRSGNETPYEIAAIRKDGSKFPVEIHTANYSDERENARVAVFIDISERKQSEQLLRVQRDLSMALSAAHGIGEVLTCLVDHILEIEGIDSVCICVRDFEGGSLTAEIERKISGGIGRSVKPLSPESPLMQMAMTGNVSFIDFGKPGSPLDEQTPNDDMRATAVIPVKNGEDLIAALICSSRKQREFSKNTRSSIEAISGIIGGAIARVQAEASLLESEELLHQSEKMRAIGQLAGGIAHDFNNQLVGIVGFAEILKMRVADDPDLVRFAANIVKSAQRAADLTSKLLAFARKGKCLSVPVDVGSIVSEVTGILEHSVDKRITIVQRLRANPSLVLGDPSQLQNVLLNLALNARDAMPEGGELTFTNDNVRLDEKFCSNNPFGLEPGNFVRITVSDSGVGMDIETQRRIFEPFFTTKPHGSGTGMGLAAAYGAIKNHRGSITVESRVNRGTVFTILLPAAASPEDESDDVARSDISVAETGHIMVIDDEPIVCETCAAILEQLGHKVTQCTNGPLAIRKYEQMRDELALVVLDLAMPEMTGREVFSQLKRINPGIRVLLSSGYSRDNDAQAIIDEGASDFIQKPFQVEELSRKVAALLRSS